MSLQVRKGSGTSASGTRRTVPLTGTFAGCVRAGGRLPEHPEGRCGWGGWRHQGPVRARPGAQSQDLYERLRSKRYRHQPIRRVHIPKDGGRTRPIGISALEDKVVQGAVRHVLEAIYEQDFLDCSFGFRPGRMPTGRSALWTGWFTGAR